MKEVWYGYQINILNNIYIQDRIIFILVVLDLNSDV